MLQTNAVKVSKRLLNKPRKPVQLAADVVDRVLLTGGEPYLQTKEAELPWWKVAMLDVYVFLALIVLLTAFFLWLLLRFAFV